MLFAFAPGLAEAVTAVTAATAAGFSVLGFGFVVLRFGRGGSGIPASNRWRRVVYLVPFAGPLFLLTLRVHGSRLPVGES